MLLNEEELSQDLTDIVMQVTKMAEIIDHMRIFTRNSNDMQMESIILNDVVEGPLKLLGQQLKNHNIEVVKEYGPNLLKITGNTIRIEQVLLNLITNARNALNKSSREDKKLWIKKFQSDNKKIFFGEKNVVVEIKDNGCGIKKEIKEKIFQPFFTTNAPGEGTGLGLSVSYKIINEHKGKIAVDSEIDVGTSFKVIFPIQD